MAFYGPANLRLPICSNTLLIAATSGGKSTLCIQICLNRNKIFDEKIEKVVYLIQDNQDIFDRARKIDESIHFVTTIEDFEEQIKPDESLNTSGKGILVCFDDFIINAMKEYSTYVLDFMIRRSHHQKYTVLFNTQLLYPSQAFRRVTLNVHHYIFFRNHHITQLHYFFRSISPTNYKALLEAYSFCVNEKKFGYFFVSIHPFCEEKLRYRNFIEANNGAIVFSTL